nr:MAG TPA: hypothetical protein [Bacteriophage sp.]
MRFLLFLFIGILSLFTSSTSTYINCKNKPLRINSYGSFFFDFSIFLLIYFVSLYL